MRHLACVVFMGVLACALTTSSSHAQTTAAEADVRGRSLFDEGRNAFDDGRFAEALALFEQAYQGSARPQLLFNIARAAEESGDEQRAIAAYGAYLEKIPDAGNRGFVETRLRKLRNVESASTARRYGASDVASTRPANEAPTQGSRRVAPAASVAGPRPATVAPAAATALAHSAETPAHEVSRVPGRSGRGVTFEQADGSPNEPLTLYLRTSLSGEMATAEPSGLDMARPLCVSPCQPNLKPGEYALSLGRGTEKPVPIKQIVSISGDERLVGSYRSRKAARVVGTVLVVVGSVICIGLSSVGDPVLIGAGAAALVLGASIGFPLMFMRPKAYLRKFVPAAH